MIAATVTRKPKGLRTEAVSDCPSYRSALGVDGFGAGLEGRNLQVAQR